jgi:hypothetical protein
VPEFDLRAKSLTCAQVCAGAIEDLCFVFAVLLAFQLKTTHCYLTFTFASIVCIRTFFLRAPLVYRIAVRVPQGTGFLNTACTTTTWVGGGTLVRVEFLRSSHKMVHQRIAGPKYICKSNTLPSDSITATPPPFFCSNRCETLTCARCYSKAACQNSKI